MGRPRKSADPDRAAIDHTIGNTVWQLLAWGYTLRGDGNILAVVAQLAREHLKLEDHAGFALSERTIEETFHAWEKLPTLQRGRGWRTSTRPWRPWTDTHIDSLRDAGPRDLAITEIAARLLKNGGWWDGQLHGHHGHPSMTAGAWARRLRMPRPASDIESIPPDASKSRTENPDEG